MSKLSTLLRSLLPAEWYRRYLLKWCANDELRGYLQTPLVDASRSLFDTEFIVLDFETTGLDAKCDRILTIGFTVIRSGRVVMKQNAHWIVKPDQVLDKNSVVIHNITDDRAEQGRNLSQSMATLLSAMAGRVIVAHHAVIETGFLDAVCEKLYGQVLPLRVIDTLTAAKKTLDQQHRVLATNDLRLFNLRKRYNLPRYKAHDALQDAIATAELFLAMASQKCKDLHRCKVRDFL